MGGAGDALPAGMVKRSTPTAALAAAPAFFPAAAMVSDGGAGDRRMLMRPAGADANVARGGARLALACYGPADVSASSASASSAS